MRFFWVWQHCNATYSLLLVNKRWHPCRIMAAPHTSCGTCVVLNVVIHFNKKYNWLSVGHEPDERIWDKSAALLTSCWSWDEMWVDFVANKGDVLFTYLLSVWGWVVPGKSKWNVTDCLLVIGRYVCTCMHICDEPVLCKYVVSLTVCWLWADKL